MSAPRLGNSRHQDPNEDWAFQRKLRAARDATIHLSTGHEADEMENMMTLTMTSESLTSTSAGERHLAALPELLPLLRSQAQAIEEARELTPPVLQALRERNYFGILMSPARGEGDVSLHDTMVILEALASADASTAWDVMAAMGAAILSAFLPEEGAARMFAGPADVAATAVGRIGKAVAVDGGYLVEARWPFLSGSPHANWIGGLCIVHDGDTPRISPEGQPHVVVPFIRKERVTMLDTWHATGLRGTGSHDAEVTGAFVPASEVADFARGPRAGLPLLYSIDENAAAPLAAASVAIGIAQGAIEAFREGATKRAHQSGVMASAAPLPQLALASAEGHLDQARASIRTLARALDNEMVEGRLPDAAWVRRVSLAATAATETAIDVVSTLYRAAGSSAVFTGSPLERALRDIFTIGAHRMLQRENYLVHAPQLFS